VRSWLTCNTETWWTENSIEMNTIRRLSQSELKEKKMTISVGSVSVALRRADLVSK